MKKGTAEHNNIRSLGWVAFFGGFGQDIMQPILPLFYSTVLGLNKEMIGLIEGCMTSLVSIFRILSGIISDKLGKRKSIVFIGYLLSAAARFLFGFVILPWEAFFCRLADGIGKGAKDAPRDALVAQSSKEEKMGFSFGYQQMLDTFGSVGGPLITAGLMYLLAQSMLRFKLIFFIGGLISFIPLLLIALFVSEKRPEGKKTASSLDFHVLKGKFLIFSLIMLLFTLGNSSDSYLILRAQNLGINAFTISLIYALFNLFYALLSTPFGILADKIGKIRVMQLGWLIFILAYLGFALANKAWEIWIVFIFYGMYYAADGGAAKALVAGLVPEEQRGTAYGIFNATLGIMTLPANLIAGFLWDQWSPAVTFYFGALCALLALVLFSLTFFRQGKFSNNMK